MPKKINLENDYGNYSESEYGSDSESEYGSDLGSEYGSDSGSEYGSDSGSEYGSEEFTTDLNQLKKLVKEYQSGGKKDVRYFTVSKVDDKFIPVGEGGRYTVKPGKSPGDAVRRAFSQVCRKMGDKKDGVVKILTFRETTQGSAKKEHIYECKMVKLKKPRKGPVDKKTGKPVMFHFEPQCKKFKDEDDKFKGGFYI